jgi:sugar phosphate isomerase/epimerase
MFSYPLDRFLRTLYTHPSVAVHQIRAAGGNSLKVGLYSITYLGVWYDGEPLTIPALIERAKRFGYDGVEIDGKRPHGHPLDLSPNSCRDLRLKAADAGIEIYAVAANSDFSSPITEYRESQLGYVRDLIRATGDIGASTLRVFAAWPGIYKSETGASYDVAEHIWDQTHAQFSAEQVWDWCREGLIQAAEWAADAGVTLALQNHPAVVNNYQDMLRMINEVNSPSLKAAFDAPLARKQGVRDMRTAAHEVGALQVLTHFGGEYDEDADGSVKGIVRARNGSVTPEDFYVDFAVGMNEIGYNGYTGYELCHPLPRIDGKPATIEFVDKNAKLAARFMREVIARAESLQAAGVAK